jgi:hypothetical protein
MNPNEMTDPRVVKAENKLQAQAEALAKKGAYKRLMENPDFIIFYNYLETCYNSYMEAGGSVQTPKEAKDHMFIEAAFIHKTFEYLKRQAK